MSNYGRHGWPILDESLTGAVWQGGVDGGRGSGESNVSHVSATSGEDVSEVSHVSVTSGEEDMWSESDATYLPSDMSIDSELSNDSLDSGDEDVLAGVQHTMATVPVNVGVAPDDVDAYCISMSPRMIVDLHGGNGLATVQLVSHVPNLRDRLYKGFVYICKRDEYFSVAPRYADMLFKSLCVTRDHPAGLSIDRAVHARAFTKNNEKYWLKKVMRLLEALGCPTVRVAVYGQKTELTEDMLRYDERRHYR